MAGDIRKTTDVDVEGFVVRVAPELEGEGYVAAVVEYREAVLTKKWDKHTSGAPIVTDPDRYVIIGKAIKAFRDAQEDDKEGEAE